SFGAVNALGIYALSAVNAFAAWSSAGINATGIGGHGGVNTEVSILPALLTIAALIAASFVARGSRASRTIVAQELPLRRFLASTELGVANVTATLVAAQGGSLVLSDGGESIAIETAPEIFNK